MKKSLYSLIILVLIILIIIKFSLINSRSIHDIKIRAYVSLIIYVLLFLLWIIRTIAQYQDKKRSKRSMITQFSLVGLILIGIVGYFNRYDIFFYLTKHELTDKDNGFIIDFPVKFEKKTFSIQGIANNSIPCESYAGHSEKILYRLDTFGYPANLLDKYSPVEIMLFHISQLHSRLYLLGTGYLHDYENGTSGISFHRYEGSYTIEGYIYMQKNRCYRWYFLYAADHADYERKNAYRFRDSFNFSEGLNWDRPDWKNKDTHRWPRTFSLTEKSMIAPHKVAEIRDSYFSSRRKEKVMQTAN